MEVMIEKASELGVSEIHPIKTRHLALKKINPERLSSIAAEAAEQCERLDVPPVHAMKDIAQFLGDHPTDPTHHDFRPIFYGDETGHAQPFFEALRDFTLPHLGGSQNSERSDTILVGGNVESESPPPHRSGASASLCDSPLAMGEYDILKKWAVLVGPEGGFASPELEQLRAHPACIGVSLGPRILRADTASTTLLSLTMAIFGDWHNKPSFRNADDS